MKLTIFKRMQVVAVMQACLILMIFLLAIFAEIDIMEWWIKSYPAQIVSTVFFGSLHQDLSRSCD